MALLSIPTSPVVRPQNIQKGTFPNESVVHGEAGSTRVSLTVSPGIQENTHGRGQFSSQALCGLLLPPSPSVLPVHPLCCSRSSSGSLLLGSPPAPLCADFCWSRLALPFEGTEGGARSAGASSTLPCFPSPVLYTITASPSPALGDQRRLEN